MTVFNRRNALVGFATLKARDLKRLRRRERSGRGLKVALLVTAAVVSVGVLAGVAAAYKRGRQPGGPQHLEGYLVAEEAEIADEAASMAEADATAEPAAAEPVSAT